MNLSGRQRDLLKRYGLAVALAALALGVRGALPVPTGTAVYQLPLAAVILSGWFGGRGPGLVALLICATGILYWFIPPDDSFHLPPDYQLGLLLFIFLGLLFTEFSGARRRVEQALRESEERFHALVQFSFDVYWESDTQHRFTRQEFSERLTDVPQRQSEIGKTRWQVPYLEPDEEDWRQHRATLDAHEPFRDFELARPTAAGGKRYVSVSGIPVFDAAGRFAGYRGVGRSITERKLAEEEHRVHLWFLESMDRINRAIQATSDLERMMSEVLEAVLDIFTCDRAWLIHPCDPDAASWHAVMEHTKPEYPGAFLQNVDQPVDDEIAAVFAAARAAGGAVVFGPGSPLPLPPRAAERFAIRSQIAMTVAAKVGAPYLFGLHQCSRERAWTADEQRLFEEIGHRLPDALSSLIALRSLRESERRLEAAQRLAGVGWWERNYVTGRVTMSDETCRIFGVPPDDLSQWQETWLNLVHPEDRERTSAAKDAALRGGPRYDIEYRVVRPDGTVRVVHSHADVSLDESGRPLRQFGAMQDITERRRAEESLRQSEAYLADTQRLSHTGSWALDVATNQYVYASEESDRMWGFDPQGEKPTQQAVSERIHPEDRSSWKRNFEKSLREKVDTFDEYRIVLPDGTVRHLRTIRHPVLNSAGEVVKLVGTSIDITEQKRAEEERETLRRLEADLAHANRLTTMGELTASIAHEVNQPLGAMVANAAACTRWLAAEPPEAVKARRALESIAADGRRASEIIGRIRALVKRQAPRKDPVDVNLKIAQVIELTTDEIRRNGIVLRTELADGLPPVHGDRVQLQQVLLNLILNAIDAMGLIENRRRELTIVSRGDGGDAVLVEVHDAGPGIDPKQAAQVFEPFYTTKSDGLGIGLSISRSIVEAHGGKLWVDANEPHGAVFRFSLPVGEAAS